MLWRREKSFPCLAFLAVLIGERIIIKWSMA
jgi:hypothetical protein